MFVVTGKYGANCVIYGGGIGYGCGDCQIDIDGVLRAFYTQRWRRVAAIARTHGDWNHLRRQFVAILVSTTMAAVIVVAMQIAICMCSTLLG